MPDDNNAEEAVFRREVGGKVDDIVIQPWDGLADCAHFLSRCLTAGGFAIREISVPKLVAHLTARGDTKVLAERVSRERGQGIVDTGILKRGDMLGYFNINPDGDYNGKRQYFGRRRGRCGGGGTGRARRGWWSGGARGWAPETSLSSPGSGDPPLRRWRRRDLLGRKELTTAKTERVTGRAVRGLARRLVRALALAQRLALLSDDRLRIHAFGLALAVPRRDRAIIVAVAVRGPVQLTVEIVERAAAGRCDGEGGREHTGHAAHVCRARSWGSGPEETKVLSAGHLKRGTTRGLALAQALP